MSPGVTFALMGRGRDVQDTEEACKGLEQIWTPQNSQFFPCPGDLPGACSPPSRLGWGKGRPLVI